VCTLLKQWCSDVLSQPLRQGLEVIVQSGLPLLPVAEFDGRWRGLAGLGTMQQFVGCETGCQHGHTPRIMPVAQLSPMQVSMGPVHGPQLFLHRGKSHDGGCRCDKTENVELLKM
jgi:hypothetical protein